ncbi:hypothetical protein BDN72DRAFT_832615 [Pluteus cervinus]|uniref:Uncharacterized protein n=1 Tax=Pluteus cervinus TaxID=181527 RepID=A0ACD3BD36_9AGAR|nr:hypothetical protein BDN72DRAFT_832615 [Pluteus cervinus]
MPVPDDHSLYSLRTHSIPFHPHPASLLIELFRNPEFKSMGTCTMYYVYCPFQLAFYLYLVAWFSELFYSLPFIRYRSACMIEL